jgi:hypothetical protein
MRVGDVPEAEAEGVSGVMTKRQKRVCAARSYQKEAHSVGDVMSHQGMGEGNSESTDVTRVATRR